MFLYRPNVRSIVEWNTKRGLRRERVEQTAAVQRKHTRFEQLVSFHTPLRNMCF